MKHSRPIFRRYPAPIIDITISIVGCVDIQLAASRLTITSGPSVNMGAVAVHIPALRPPESVSLITMVSRGPGLTPSTIPSVSPAVASARTRERSMPYLLDAIANLARSLRISR